MNLDEQVVVEKGNREKIEIDMCALLLRYIIQNTWLSSLILFLIIKILPLSFVVSNVRSVSSSMIYNQHLHDQTTLMAYCMISIITLSGL